MTTDARSKLAADRILELGIKAHAELLVPILVTDAIAVAVFEPSPQIRQVATTLGWDGEAPVFRMSRAVQKMAARSFADDGDHVSARWHAAKRPGRILMLVHSGTILINFTDEDGYRVEPGSRNAERAS